MKVININSNNPELIKNLVIRYLIINQVNYLDNNYDDYYEIHFNNTIFRIKYSLIDCNENIIFKSISDMSAEKIKEIENNNINLQSIVKKKNNFPKPKKQNFQLVKKKNTFIYEKNKRLNNKSHRHF